MKYSEEYESSQVYKKQYKDSFDKLVGKLQKNAEEQRAQYIKDVFKNPEKYRRDFREMLGWPMVNYDGEKIPKVIFEEKLSEEDTHDIYRMQFEILGGLKITGLFFKAKGEEKRPLVIAQHGALGTPEVISDIYDYTANYHHMTKRILKYGVHVFAPQLLLWNSDRYGVEYDRQGIDLQLRRFGASVVSVEVYAITSIINYFETKSYVKNFGMVGLSYGGFYTLFTAAADTRIKSAVSCSFFNTRDKVLRGDWVWNGNKFDDAEVACLIYPRRLCIELGTEDELFDYRGGLSSFEKLKSYCEETGTDWTEMILFKGVHEFCKEDAPIERLAKDLLEE